MDQNIKNQISFILTFLIIKNKCEYDIMTLPLFSALEAGVYHIWT